MLSQPELILLTGLVRILVGSYGLYTVNKTWDNVHPQGSEISPKYVLAISCLFFNDGLRAIAFYFDPYSDGVFLSLYITFLLCSWVLYRTHRVTRTITHRLK